MWSQSRSTHYDFRRAHVWGCPVYVLEPKLQDGQKIPKWLPRARLGMFMGFSHVHSSLVPLVLNVTTGKISPQYHVVSDDKFTTVNSLPSEGSLEKQQARIFKLKREFYLDFEFDEKGNLVTDHWPDLGNEWLDPKGCDVPTILQSPITQASGGVQASGGALLDHVPPAHRTRSKTAGQPPAIQHSGPTAGDEFIPSSFVASHKWGQPPAQVANLDHSVPSKFKPT